MQPHNIPLVNGLPNIPISSGPPTMYILNATSLAKPFAIQHLRADLQSYKVDVCAITESWFKPHHSNKSVNIPGYVLYRKDRVGRKGGGVAVYVTCSFKSNTVDMSSIVQSSYFETLWVEVIINNDVYYICTVYHPPKPLYDQSDLIKYLSECIDSMLCKSIKDNVPKFLLVGDFNTLPEVAMADLGLTNYVTAPTHGNNVIDKLYSFVSFYDYINVVTSTVKTAHRAVVASNMFYPADYNKTRVVHTLRPYSPLQFQNVMAYMSGIKCPITTTCYTDIPSLSADFTHYYNFLKAMLDKYFPQKTVTITSKDPYYMTPYIKYLLRQKQKLIKKSKLESANNLTVKIQQQINNKISKTFNSTDTNQSIWKKINVIRGKNCSAPSGPNNITADSLNVHYASTSTDQHYQPVVQKLTCPNNPVFHDKMVEPYVIFNFLNSLTTTSPGLDQLPHWFLRLLSPLIAEPLAKLFSASISLGYVPPEWKLSLISPIPKVSLPTSPSEYRPISITPILCRIFEKHFVRSFFHPLMLTDLVAPQVENQFAFRPTGSTTAALVQILHTTTNLLAEHSFVHIVALDFSKAFDTVRHSTLTNTLSDLGLPDEPYNWMCNFLTGRQHVTKYGNVLSTPASINASVVQGSGSGPTCFILNMCGLKPLHPNNFLFFYADDGYLITPATCSHTIPAELSNISCWAEKSNLKLNLSKTQELIISRKNFNRQYLPAPLPNIKRVDTLTTLGVTFDCYLSFSPHVQTACTKCYQRLYTLKILKSHGLDQNSLSNVTKSILISVLLYAAPAWRGFLNKAEIEKIQSVINKAVKWGYLKNCENFNDLADKADQKFFMSITTNKDHALAHLLPPVKSTPYNLRGSTRELPDAATRLQRCCFINRMVFKDLY